VCGAKKQVCGAAIFVDFSYVFDAGLENTPLRDVNPHGAVVALQQINAKHGL